MTATDDIQDDELLALLLGDETTAPRISPRDSTRPAPLSYAQQRLWIEQQYDAGSSAYNLPRAFRLKGQLHAEALESALAQVIERHQILRSRFVEINGQPFQEVDPQACFRLDRQDLRAYPAAEREALLDQRIQAQNTQPFDLTRGPLLRAQLLQLDEQEHALLITMHHIVSDAWSNAILVQDLCEAYRISTGTREHHPLPALAVQYADYAQWQRDTQASGKGLEHGIAYWRSYLGNDFAVLELPTDRPRLKTTGQPAAHCHIQLPAVLKQQVDALCAREGITPFVVFLAAWQILLSRYSGQQDFCVGVPNATRHLEETQALVGCFVSTQVYRARLDARMSAVELLRRLRKESQAALQHADVPFELLLDNLSFERSAEHAPIFQTLFNWRVEDNTATLFQLGDLELAFIDSDLPQAKFDLSIDAGSGPAGYYASLEYNAELFDASTVQRMAGHWQNLIKAISAQPEQALGDLALLDPVERRLILEDWNPPALAINSLPVHQRISAQAALTPDAIALLLGDARLSYAELEQQANRLAHRLIAMGVGPDVRVGVAFERSMEMVIGLLAILKAGGAYVPLDPEYPQDRLRHMMQDSGIALVLTQAAIGSGLSIPEGIAVMNLNLNAADLASYAGDAPLTQVSPLNLAYVIYTSGSTGMPKGVDISHEALTGHTDVAIGYFQLSAQDRVLLFSSLNFDGFIEQLFPALCVGAGVIIRGNEVWDSESFYREVIDNGMTVADLSTAYWFLIAQEFARKGPRDYGRLRQVSATGEAMPPEGVKLWSQAGLGHVRLLNTYGPTETTVTASFLDCAEYVCGARPLPALMPIGTPLGGRTLYVLDGNLEPVPAGVVGELYIGGPLLARAYHNRAALTAERFVLDALGPQPGGRLYRTGDLVHYRADGVIEYIGRADHQVKIRGFRIELGEIEARLLHCAEVREALVVTLDGANGKQLAAYLVPADPTLADADLDTQKARLADVRAQLKASLPDYMQPTFWVLLAQLPLTPNGKLDRNALPAPDPSMAHSDYVPPQTALQTRLALIWQEVLKVEQVGLHDNFFELGGHSLLATQVVVRVREQLGVELPIRELFGAEHLLELAEKVEALQAAANPLQDELARTLALLKSLSSDDIEDLISQ
ncbi:amino acid adenylation domain-containing protein [Pseudomonas sp. FP2309]|uniref:amino acid adenylation domain-containing protein n=1 Tax=Pseudomonas sp. FP2309 TaxID=2954091 RepID=UPI002733375E|nr:amino acid adenylation domain-containing protein [Pseudomonas sp. FP2309]WLH70579.1 amino acid adenylation domain-containing protein [Pseudomonas sp. FP2309]